jgi:hypothetical protein
MIQRLTKEDRPLSHGTFKPVGHVMIALRDEARAGEARRELLEAGFEEEDILYYSAGEAGAEMAWLIDHASEFAGFGYEITMMRRYQELARLGCEWLLVYSPEDAPTSRLTEIAKQFGAMAAVKYHRLVVEDLI